MATIPSLIASGDLIKLDPQLEPNEQEHRLMCALPTLIPRLRDEVPNWTSTWQIEQSPLQQLDALLEIYCSGEALTFNHRFKPLNHLGEGVWELKTPDLRLFGWFPAQNVVVVTFIDLAWMVKSYGLYRGYASEVVRLRSHLALDEPKFVSGEDPNDVVSPYTLP